MSTSSAAATAPTVVECTLIEHTSFDFFFFYLSQTDENWLVCRRRGIPFQLLDSPPS
jgi:hypothetical protein